MKHRISKEGYGYKLRPAKPVDLPQALSVDFNLTNEYYFALESRIDKNVTAVFALVCSGESSAKVRVLTCESTAFDEALFLICSVTFNELEKLEICFDNTAKTLELISNIKISLPQNENETISKVYFDEVLSQKLETIASEIFEKAIANAIGELEFHHIGVATKSIVKELAVYTLMGYKKEGDFFEDKAQGIRGLFITKSSHPRLELLENLKDSSTLDKQLELNQKLYHTAYYVNDIEKAMDLFLLNRAKIISPLKSSVYFKKRICFLMLPNMSMIELLEK